MARFVHELNSLYPTDCPTLKQIREEYADWKWYLAYGYVCYCKKSAQFLEHKLVASIAHGEIPKGHHVHHIDECKTNNAASNLMIVSPSEHNRLHSASLQVELKCSYCKKSIRTGRQRRINQENAFCNHKCRLSFLRPGPTPSRNELQELMSSHGVCDIGRMFDVSHTTVRRWAKKYQLA